MEPWQRKDVVRSTRIGQQILLLPEATRAPSEVLSQRPKLRPRLCPCKVWKRYANYKEWRHLFLSYQEKNAQAPSCHVGASRHCQPTRAGCFVGQAAEGRTSRVFFLNCLGPNPAFPAFRTAGVAGQRAGPPKSLWGTYAATAGPAWSGAGGLLLCALLGSVPH